MNLFENQNFSVSDGDLSLQVTEHSIGDQQVFHVVFGDGRKPIVVSRAFTATGKLWTSIPQGRQKEAERVGALISQYFKNK